MQQRAGAALTSVVYVVNDVEVVLHRGAVSAAEAGGEQQEQRQSCGQPASRQDALPDSSFSFSQHAGGGGVGQGTEEHWRGNCWLT